MSARPAPHILIVSNKCPHSLAALASLKSTGCISMVKVVCAEDPRVQLPAWVRKVPVMVTGTGQRITDDDLFWFIRDCLPTLNAAGPPKPISTPSEMASRQVARNRRGDDTRYDRDPGAGVLAGLAEAGDNGPAPFATSGMDTAFSDSFSFLSGGERSMVSYSAADSYQKITTPVDDGSAGPDSRRSACDASLDKLLSQRDRDIQNVFGKPPRS